LPQKSLSASVIWDRLGIGISTVCAIHCLFFPVLIATLPMWGFASILHEWAHPVFIVLIAPTVYIASKRSHFNKLVTATLTAGLALIILGWILGHHLLGIWFETAFTVAGSGLLIMGHWKNYRHHRTCKNSRHNHHPDVSDA
jgi:hypothetical protein